MTQHFTHPRRRRAYVACRLFPETAEHLAVARLNRWIRSDPQLRKRLLAAGYRPRQREFTPRQIGILKYYFG